MDSRCGQFSATVIVSTYKDHEKLACVLDALERQSISDFEILVSEDGDSRDICTLVASRKHDRLSHLSQEDRGFRKNRALNRAIRSARSDYFIFLDGDCVPHRQFVENHLRHAEPGTLCSGRRVELGPQFSRKLLSDKEQLAILESPLHYLLLGPRLHRDGVKNYEYGFTSHRIQRWFGRKPPPLVGCNFSCARAAMEAINGFDEEYEGYGIGEDSDVDLRLRIAGWRIKNIKFLATVYHLWHPRSARVSDENKRRLANRRADGTHYCARGLMQG